MREIIFRGKRVDNGEWVEGYYCYSENVHWIIPIVDDCGNAEDGFDQIFPESVGQYTGLKDKNGKKIFDGDIIYIDSNEIFFIYWDNHLRGFSFAKSKTNKGYKNGYMTELECWKILGNTTDNPELLEETK